jgi:hypothetical protein
MRQVLAHEARATRPHAKPEIPAAPEPKEQEQEPQESQESQEPEPEPEPKEQEPTKGSKEQEPQEPKEPQEPQEAQEPQEPKGQNEPKEAMRQCVRGTPRVRGLYPDSLSHCSEEVRGPQNRLWTGRLVFTVTNVCGAPNGLADAPSR